jgi:DNA-binding HxlR family transcriptional regulator
MNQNKNYSESLLLFLKALADETRLIIIGLLSEREYSVGELASDLNLTDATISHHLSKLREAGLVNLRQHGTSRFYSLNESTLARMAEHLANPKMLNPKNSPESDDKSWIEDLPLDEDDRKVLRDYTFKRRLKQIPVKQKKLLAVLRYLTSRFAVDVKYTEREVNGVIEAFHHDYVTLRRELVNFHYLEREGGGGVYWRGAGPEDE